MSLRKTLRDEFYRQSVPGFHYRIEAKRAGPSEWSISVVVTDEATGSRTEARRTIEDRSATTVQSAVSMLLTELGLRLSA